MKKYFPILIAILMFSAISCEDKTDIEKEKAAVIAVIEEETDAFIHKDYERWANTYLQDETNVRISASISGYDHVVGWNKLSTGFREYFDEPLTEEPSMAGEKTNYQVKIYDDVAWVMCDEKFKNIETGEYSNWEAVEARFLEKVDSQWKIVFLAYIDTLSYNGIIGAWNLAEMKYVQNGSVTYTLPEGNVSGEQIKIWSNGHFSFVGKFKTGSEIINNYGGGTFSFDGKFYEENILFHSGEGAVGNKVKMLLEITDDTLIQQWPVDADGNIDKNNYSVEKYVRLD